MMAKHQGPNQFSWMRGLPQLPSTYVMTPLNLARKYVVIYSKALRRNETLEKIFKNDWRRVEAVGSLYLYAEYELVIGENQELYDQLGKWCTHTQSYELMDTNAAREILAFLVNQTGQQPQFNEEQIAASQKNLRKEKR